MYYRPRANEISSTSSTAADMPTMSQRKLKRKYLRKAQHLIQRAGKTQKLQASVGPFICNSPHHHGHHGYTNIRTPSLGRSYSDPTAAFSHHPFPTRTRTSHLTHDHTPYERGIEKPVVLKEGVDPFSIHEDPVARYPSSDLCTPPTSPCSHSSKPTPKLYRDVSLRGTNLFPVGSASVPTPSTHAVRNNVSSDLDPEEEEDEAKASDSHDSYRTAAKLKQQIGVNKELKRLLIASVGSNLQLRLEQMVQEKAELSHNIDASLQQLAELSEDLDRVSIECDIWRSKYLASRVMIDELAGWKAELSLHFKESLRALRCLLSERREVSEELVKCHSEISAAIELTSGRQPPPRGQEDAIANGPPPSRAYSSGNVAAVSPVQYSHKGAAQHTSDHLYSTPRAGHPSLGLSAALHPPRLTVLDIASACVSMARAWHLASLSGSEPGEHRKGGGHLGKSLAAAAKKNHLHRPVVEPTPGEKLASQVLRSQHQAAKDRGALPLPLRLNEEELVRQRMLPTPSSSSRRRHLSPLAHSPNQFTCHGEDQITVLFHCSRCRGRVIVV